MNEYCQFVSLGQTKMLRRWRSSETLVPDSKVEGRSLSLAKQQLQADSVSAAANLLSINLQHTTRNSAYTCLQIFVVKNFCVFNFRG